MATKAVLLIRLRDDSEYTHYIGSGTEQEVRQDVATLADTIAKRRAFYAGGPYEDELWDAAYEQADGLPDEIYLHTMGHEIQVEDIAWFGAFTGVITEVPEDNVVIR